MFHRCQAAEVLVMLPEACNVPPCHRHVPAVIVALTPAGSATAWNGGSAALAVARGVAGAAGAVAGAAAGTAARVVEVVGGLVDVVDGAVLVVVEPTVLEDVRVAAALTCDCPSFESFFEPAANTRPAPIAIDASAIALPTISVRRRMRAGGAT